MSKSDPLISVIIPVYNAGDYLRSALQSVVQQTYAHWVLIIVDDGSTDELEKVLAEFLITHLVCQSNQGPAAARNRGIELVSGEFVAFLNADDRWPADKLANQLAYFLQDEALQMVTGLVEFSAPNGMDELIQYQFQYYRNRAIHAHVGAALFRRTAFDIIGLFDESMRMSEDIDWLNRAKEVGLPIKVVEEVALYHTLHQQSLTHGANVNDNGTFRAIKQSLDRRRRLNIGAVPQLSAYLIKKTNDVSYLPMTTETNSISVIIPSYNGSKYIGQALESILRQTLPATEIIVVDDGSTDDTAGVVARFGDRVKYHAKPNGGVASARNEGIRLATGGFIAFLDQDDWWPDDMLANTMAQFEREPHWQVVMGLSKITFGEGADRTLFKVSEEHLTAPIVQISSALFRREVFETVGMFNESLHAANDLDWLNRAREMSTPFTIIPTVTLYYNRHAENASNDTQWLRSEIMQAMKLSLDRRRREPDIKAIPSLNSLIKKP